MTDRPEIPDSISPDALSSLLRNRNPLPSSGVIPELDLGGVLGAPCDLQFAICQLIERSLRGTNVIQMLVAAMHLLTEVEGNLDKHLRDLAAENPPYERLSGPEQQSIATVLRQYLRTLRSSLHPLERTLAEVGYPYYQQRASELHAGPFAGQRPALRDFRSHLLISDELLASLQIERDAVTTYLDHITENVTDFQDP